MSEIRVRFAPSPTGFLHIGNARTALFNWLYAKAIKGKLILRIEDTDQERSTKEAVDMAIKSLKWLGIDWDEGPEVGGDYGPYFQSERLDIYKKYTEKLMEEGKAYYCFCTSEELEKKSNMQRTLNQPIIYDGKCKDIPLEEAKRRVANGEPAKIRFRVPKNQIVTFDDFVRGIVKTNSDEIGDIIIVRENGFPTYNYAVVIDDMLMKISHVIRGEDHISNTPKQILIYEALGAEVPRFAHTSSILGNDRKKLSKRHGAATLMEYKDEGYLPQAMRNFLALLGWTHPEAMETMVDDDMIKAFKLDRFSKSPAIFDTAKLRHLNAWHIKNMNLDEVTELFIPYLVNGGFLKENYTEEEHAWAKKLVSVIRHNCVVLSDIVKYVPVFFENDFELTDEMKEMVNKEESKKLLQFIKNDIENTDEITDEYMKALIKKAQKETGLKGPNLYHPIRYVLTGSSAGSELSHICELLGKKNVLYRLSKYI
ncbi:glutamate--tRNA ligase [Brachyspira intermedia]|uniref:Glutamate--tRNA ligase n=1 Tax=Brachyspira intermedia (strain ATCC 51140 / PWS/A) TaxID=1045858 RepID=G0EMM9_BRAIP|nr:glutamate--tRNA ligase [Brachyspira intermedia]AEM21717.1 glutamyl-tRNA synthetase [Brachyspira intermedia PWS/A]